MTRPLFGPAAAEAAERSLMLGLSRSPFPPLAVREGGAPIPPLTCLALLAQRRRFRRPSARDLSERRLLPDDDRRMVTGKLRAGLVRLLTSHGREASAIVAPAALRLLARHGLRPHPFDLPVLATALALASDDLGPAEQGFLALRRSRGKAGASTSPGQAPTIDETSWGDASKAQKIAFITAQRAVDPDRARHLVGSRIAAEPAPIRAELVRALAVGLGADDRELLETMAADRAASVKLAAQELLQRVPGTAPYGERVRKLAGAFRIERSGLLRRRAVASFTAPPRPDREWYEPLATLFAGIRLSDLAASLSLDPAGLVDALPEGQPELAVCLAQTALAEGRQDLLPALLARAAGLGFKGLLFQLAEPLRHLPQDQRLSLLRMLFAACVPDSLPDGISWLTLGSLLPEGLPPDLAQAVLRWTAWRRYLTAAGQAEKASAEGIGLVLLGVAVVMPADCAATLLRDLESLPPEVREKPVAYADFLRSVTAFAGSHHLEEADT